MFLKGITYEILSWEELYNRSTKEERLEDTKNISFKECGQLFPTVMRRLCGRKFMPSNNEDIHELCGYFIHPIMCKPVIPNFKKDHIYEIRSKSELLELGEVYFDSIRYSGDRCSYWFGITGMSFLHGKSFIAHEDSSEFNMRGYGISPWMCKDITYRENSLVTCHFNLKEDECLGRAYAVCKNGETEHMILYYVSDNSLEFRSVFGDSIICDIDDYTSGYIKIYELEKGHKL